MNDEEPKSGNYLALDGGLSGLSGLITLEELLSRLQFDLKLKEELAPWRHFKIIIGTGPGGLVAIFIGRLKMTASEAIESYARLLPTLSGPPAKDDEERRKNTEGFKEAFLGVLKDAGYDSETSMLDDDAPKTVIVTSHVLDPLTPHLIRSYRVRGSPAMPCTVLQAACACVASQDRFASVVLGLGHRKFTLVDAITGYANPTKELMREAQSVYGEESRISTILSLGAGKAMSGASVGSGREQLFEILKRGGVVCEQVHQDMQNRLSDSSVYFRFNVEQEMGTSMEAITVQTSAYLQDAAISRRLDDATKSIQSGMATIKLKDINSVTAVEIQLKPRPSLVQNFVGREEILDAMRRTHITHRSPHLRTPAVTVLSGLGGSGKTQLALRFALEFEEMGSDRPVYFLNAESEASLKSDYETLVRSFGIEHRSKSHGDALVWLANKLKNWLLIIDNADSPDLPLFSYLPKSTSGNVIITTRNSNHASLAPNSNYHIEGLPDSESVALVLQSSGYESTKENQAVAGEIVRELGNLPLALAQAAGYILVHKCLSTYVDIYRKSAVKILSSIPSQRPEDYRPSVARTIQMSLDRLPQEAQGVLKIFAHLDSTLIAHSIIAKAAERDFEHVAWTEKSKFDPRTLEHASVLRSIFYNDGTWSDFEFNELVAQCLQYSLLRITTRGDDRFYSMHVLLKSYLKASSTPIQGHQPDQLVVRLLGSSITYTTNYECLAFHRLFLPHIRLLQLGDVIEAGDHLGFGRVLNETGDGRLASAHQEKCVEMWRASLGDEHRDTLAAMANLANSYREVGRTQDALELDEQVLAMKRKFSGPEHPDTLLAMHNLAASYFQAGRREEAMEMEEEVLELRRRILGPEHPLTLLTMSNLADSYAGLGRVQDALRLEEQVLEMRRRLLGSEHPETLESMYNIANFYEKTGRETEAMELREQVTELRIRVMGSEHPETADAMWNLSCSMYTLGLKERRLDLLRTAVPAHERAFGVDHRKTIRAQNALKRLELDLEQPNQPAAL